MIFTSFSISRPMKIDSITYGSLKKAFPFLPGLSLAAPGLPSHKDSYEPTAVYPCQEMRLRILGRYEAASNVAIWRRLDVPREFEKSKNKPI